MSRSLNSPSTRILGALVAGLLLGVALAAWSPNAVPGVVGVAQPIGTAWLNALQMTVIPLVFSLLVTGIAATAEAARAGGVAARTITVILVVLTLSAIAATLLMPLFLDLVPIPAKAAAKLREALGPNVVTPTVPAMGDFLANVVPANVVTAAANSAFLSLIIFTLVFAFAVTRIESAARAVLTGFFTAVRDAMLVMIDWVIWIAPVGVFALALVVGPKAGADALVALVHYVATVSAVGICVTLAAFPIAVIGGRIGLGRFVRASLPSQAVAISTQSSLASLPAMLEGAATLGVPVATSGVVLPLAVAMMRATGPAMNMAVALYVAHWFGVSPDVPTMIAAVLVCVLTSLGSVSLPGQASFISAISPLAATMGVPVAPLGVLVAVETIPDIFRTLGNVIFDLAVTVTVAARSDPAELTAADTLLTDAPHP